MHDFEFEADLEGLAEALLSMRRSRAPGQTSELPAALPEAGVGARAALRCLASSVFGGATRLGAAQAFAHMDPPTP